MTAEWIDLVEPPDEFRVVVHLSPIWYRRFSVQRVDYEPAVRVQLLPLLTGADLADLLLEMADTLIHDGRSSALAKFYEVLAERLNIVGGRAGRAV
jgi:hypothetical protein